MSSLTDLSGAIVGSNVVVSDCSGQPIPYDTYDAERLNHSNPTPAPYETARTAIAEHDRELDILRRLTNPVNPPPPIQENDADDEGSDSESESENEIVQRLPVVVQHPYITREAVLYYSLQFINLVWALLESTIKVTKKVSTSVYSGLQEQTYYFFKDSAFPWDSRRVKLHAAGSPHVDWYYNADTKIFRREESDGHLHHFPYLTAEIYHGDLALYDITSFTESLKWTGGDAAPSANHVLSAWYLETGILLDPSLPLVLRICNEEGEMKTIPLHQASAAAAASST